MHNISNKLLLRLVDLILLTFLPIKSTVTVLQKLAALTFVIDTM
jgi:hypothetical protein